MSHKKKSGFSLRNISAGTVHLSFRILYGKNANSLKEEAITQNALCVVQPSFFSLLPWSEEQESRIRKAFLGGESWAQDSMRKLEQKLLLEWMAWLIALPGKTTIEPSVAGWLSENPQLTNQLTQKVSSQIVHRVHQILVGNLSAEEKEWIEPFSSDSWALKIQENSWQGSSTTWQKVEIQKGSILVETSHGTFSRELNPSQTSQLADCLQKSLLALLHCYQLPVSGESTWSVDFSYPNNHLQFSLTERLWKNSGTHVLADFLDSLVTSLQSPS